jgi:hypothetical protein
MRRKGAGLDRKPVLRRELAKVFERPRPDVLDDFGGGKRAKARTGFEAFVLAEPCQKSGREEIASACRIDNGIDGEGWHGENFAGGYDNRTVFGAGDDAEDIFAAQLRGGGVEIRCLIKRMQLTFVGEEDLHRPRADEPKELIAVTIDAKAIGQG